MEENALSALIIGAALDVHSELGPGLLESAYEGCLAHELTELGILWERQKPVPIMYKGARIDCGFRIDLLVERSVVLELKAVEKLAPVHTAQVITYLKLTGVRLGLLFNFNVPSLRDGIRRVALRL